MRLLCDELAAWDGKSAAALAALYEAHRPGIDELVALLDDPARRTGASWLIKHHVSLNTAHAHEAQAILDAQRSDADWATLLHLVQAIDHLELAGLECAHAAAVLRKTRAHDAPFVRAWSLSAFARIAATQEELMDEARALIMEALLRAQKPSVKARLKRAAAYLDQS